MPATEQTWRESKLMHLVFGLSALGMLIATVWMLAADHRREWKDYRQKFEGIEAWTTSSRINEEAGESYHEQLKAAKAEFEASLREVPPNDLIYEFEQAVWADAEKRNEQVEFAELDAQYKALQSAPPEERPPLREKVIETLSGYIRKARFREDDLASKKKFIAADLDVVRSEYELGVGNELPKSTLENLQERVTGKLKEVEDATLALQNATAHRKQLESVVARMDADVNAKRKAVEDLEGKIELLEKQLYERQNHAMKEIIGLPIIDAFAPKKVDQIWLPKLTINNNFRDVARFDRCTNCHQGIDKTAPGSAVKPGYQPEHSLDIALATPAEAPAVLADPAAAESLTQEERYAKALMEAYGLQLAAEGLLDPSEASISVVRPETAGAKAGLQVGDTITAVDGAIVHDKREIYGLLIEQAQWGKPKNLVVRRGVPSPYASHPRLDLFVGSLSPHKMADVGCTICHDGQGSSTSFKWASHSPDNPFQAAEWAQKYGWFENHHWIFPMYPNRFSESLCLKCHHDVTELQPSEKFPDPPAPKLVEGFQLIQDVGCFGCHEINGYDGPNRRVGPDLRTEPNYTGAAEALLTIEGLDDQQKTWAKDLVLEPSNENARHQLRDSLKNAEKLPGDPSTTKKLVALLDDVESPGKLRKVGPSLRHVASKVDYDFLYSWIRKPSDFRPNTKMPQFFGMYDHLGKDGLKDAERYEPVEIRSAVEYLLGKSQPFQFAKHPESVSEAASAERGKVAFEVRCLACHQHADFPAGKMTQGPDLTRLAAKLARKQNPDGPKWLYSWLENPSNYHPRTLMPNMQLAPVPGPDGKLVDPAADIAEFLLAGNQDWMPTDVPSRELTDTELASLDSLALEHLQAALNSRRQAQEYLKTGIPENLRNEIKGDEVELLGPMSVEKKLQYVGRRTISKYGCSGCHDIPGFEDVKPIGTGLADWARKTSDKLAFEQILEYLKHSHGAPGPLEHKGDEHGSVSDATIEEADEGAYGHTHINLLNLPPEVGYFMEKLEHHQREGFIWQKLREPRSFDYEKTQNKSYNERLRMPKFTLLNDAQRESIITFVLGLVAEPPAAQYVYKADPRRKAIVEGLQVVEKFNCTGCHALEMETWKLGYEPGDFGEPAPVTDYPFLQPRPTPQEIAASEAIDPRGLRHATIHGTPLVKEDGQPLRIDEEGSPIEEGDTTTPAFYSFVLWKDALINGQSWSSGLQNLLVPEKRIEKRYPQLGGTLPQLAYATVVREERKINANAKAEEAWGWLPPPLVGEGRKVQTEWLHSFLLDPHAIRPAAVLRMPKFNMSPADATKLVNYFAAVDGVDYPYNFDPRTRESYLAEQNAAHPDRLGDALKIVTDNNFCIKCHLLGDFEPGGSEKAKAPQLADVYRRLRPEYTLDWVANPKRILPYTGMPINIPPDKPVDQKLFKGTSEQQLNAVVDFLLNFDRYTESKTPIKQFIKPAAPAEDQAAEASPRGER